ncbi:MAG: hypothetical protein E6K53_04030 [Gammaproteobacteria bacterium]|nr:MAG: hypothetical protein E6K53_04030 [Gammaproteobacteria bacterium]
MLGNAEMRRQRYAQAAEQYRQLTALQPDAPLAQAHLTAALVAQGQCAEALQSINKALARHSRDGDLMVIYIRLASTCAAASAQERDIALDYGQLLYKQSPDTNTASAYALARRSSKQRAPVMAPPQRCIARRCNCSSSSRHRTNPGPPRMPTSRRRC